MKKLISLLAILLSCSAFADVKITQLPLGSAAGTNVNDVFPWVDTISGTTKKMTLWDLINLPPMVSTYAPKLNPTFAGVLTAPNITISAQTANTVPYLNGSKQLVSSAATPTQLGYLTNATSNLCGITQSCTLTNKTLTAPIIATIVNSGTLTLPSSTDTLVGRATTDTLTNKTLTSATATVTLTADNIVVTDNKSIVLGGQTGGSTAASANKLFLAGSPYRDTTNGNNGWLQFNSSNNRTASDRSWVIANNQSAAGDLGFYVSSAANTAPTIYSASPDSPKLRIDSSGNVGIGMAPSNLLDLSVGGAGSSTLSAMLGLQTSVTSGSSSGGMGSKISFYKLESSTNREMAYVGAVRNSGATDYGDLVFGTLNGGTSAAEKMRIDRSGVVTLNGSATQNLTISGGTGERIERALVVCSTSSSIASQSGTWISFPSNRASGCCTFTISGFSATPICVASLDTTASPTEFISNDVASSSSLKVCKSANSDFSTNIICMGPK